MLTILNGTDIEYTKDDTFELKVTAADGFEDGMQLSFVIALNENSTPLINNRYDLTPEGAFKAVLSAGDKERLLLGDYKYKLVLTSAGGTVITQTSGNFKVKWGCMKCRK